MDLSTVWSKNITSDIPKNNVQHNKKIKLSDFTVSCIDDILILSKTFSEHIEHLSKLFEAIKIEGFRLKFMNYRFIVDLVK